jgi:hypothetical protein
MRKAALMALVTLGSIAPWMLMVAEGAEQTVALAEGAVPMTSETRDKVYRETLAVAERFNAVWKQQPDNRPALERYLSEARDKVNALCGEQGAVARSAAPGGARTRVVESAEAKPPSGPVEPSQEASSAADVERRMEATLDQLHGVGVREEVRPSLAGVEETWIARQCEEARARLSEVERALMATPRDDAALERALDQMYAGLLRMGSPPPETRPVLPRAPQSDSG